MININYEFSTNYSYKFYNSIKWEKFKKSQNFCTAFVFFLFHFDLIFKKLKYIISERTSNNLFLSILNFPENC